MGELIYDEMDTMQSGDNIVARNFWSVEACGLDDPYIWPILRDQSHAPLHTSGRGGGRPHYRTTHRSEERRVVR